MKRENIFKFLLIFVSFCLVPILSTAQDASETDKVISAMELLNATFCEDTEADETSEEAIKKLCKTYLAIYRAGKAQGIKESTPIGTPWRLGNYTFPGSGTCHTGAIIMNYVPVEASSGGSSNTPVLCRPQHLLVLDGMPQETIKKIQQLTTEG